MVDVEVLRLLEQLPGVEDVRPQWTELDRWAAAGEVGRLRELGHILVTRRADGQWMFDSVLERVERLLALTSGAEWARAAAWVVGDRAVPVGRVRRMAALLAQGQEPDVLLSLLRDVSTELGACLLQEMVVRGVGVGAVARAWEERLSKEGHPLAGLPLSALPGEGRLPIRSYGHNGSSVEMPFGPTETVAAPEGRAVAADRVTTPERGRELTAAVRTWLEQSNGKAEAEVFACAEPISADDVGTATLAAMPLECGAEGPIALRRADLDAVVALLFSAAANGGAYDWGLGGAYGRAATWASMAALTGAAPDTPAAEIAAADHSWWTFDASTPWFYGVAWDLGILALHPDNRTLTVLAATDTD